jgi:hypothetical protein
MSRIGDDSKWVCAVTESDLGTPRGLEISSAAGCALNLRGALMANSTGGCARSNPLGLEISMNSLVNLTRYGYGAPLSTRRKKSDEGRVTDLGNVAAGVHQFFDT